MISLISMSKWNLIKQCDDWFQLTEFATTGAREAPFPICEQWWQPQNLSLQAAPAVTGPNPGAAGMTGEWCQSPWSVTGSSGRISHAPLSCLPSILPLPIIVNQSGIVSTGGAVQQAIAGAAGCSEQHACQPLHQHGATRGPAQETAWAGCHH